MRNLLLLSSILSFTALSVQASLEDETKPSCAEMGYNTTVSSCLAAGGTPLLCPFSELDNNSCMCLSQSCRGYNLLKDDKGSYYYLNDDGSPVEAQPVEGTIEANINGSIESCTVGFEGDNITYYRVPSCKDGYLYQNNICDIGCDTVNKYPYSYHPGNLPGKVEVCTNEAGEWYGYSSCNKGWTLKAGKCNLNDCDIKNYPYNGNPNLKKERGVTDECRIGGNPYYKYVSCAEGYELKNSVCVGSCEIDISNCQPNTVNIDTTNYHYSYNNWKCGLTAKDKTTCMIGDNATINGKAIGTIFYMSDDQVLVLGENQGNIKWGTGLAETTDIPTEILPNITTTALAIQDYEGKKKTYAIKAYVDSDVEDDFADDSYPAASKCYNYSVTNCSHAMCQQGEWYLPSLGELGYMYDNRYILYNVTGSKYFYNSYMWSSTESYATYAWHLHFSSGYRGYDNKFYTFYVRPVLAF